MATISSICSRICSGGTPKSTENSYYGGTIPWLNTKEIDFNVIESTEKTITEAGLNNSSAKWVEAPCVIVAMYGATAGKVAISNIRLTTNQACCNLNIDTKKADYRFVYYALKNDFTRLSSMANGGAQQNLNAQQIKDFDIPDFSLSEQKKIAAILSSLDEKIETNRNINARLEELAQAIFKSWFIDFEPFGGKMPVDWKILKVGEVGIINERQYSLSEKWTDFQYLDTGNITENTIGELQQFSNNADLPSRARRKVKKLDIIYSTVRPNQRHFGLLLNPDKNWLVSTGFTVLSANETIINSFYLYMVISQKSVSNYLQTLGEQATSAYPSVNASDIANLEIMVPNLELQNQFGLIISKFHQLKYELEQQSSRLASLRDALLPKLMSGELMPE